MKKSIQLLSLLLFTVFMLTAVADVYANASNPLLTEYLELSKKAKETTAATEASEVIINTDEIYNYACAPKLEESTVYDFIDK